MIPFRHTPAAAAALLMALAGPAAAATFNWTNGNFVAGTTAPNPLVSGDELNISTTGAKNFLAVTWVNGGIVNWQASSGSVAFTSAASVTNNGLWDAQGNAGFTDGGGTASSFVNNGIFRKSGGSGNTTVGGGVGFINNGTLDAQTGTLRLSGEAMVFNAGSVFTGAGAVQVTTGSTFNGAFTSSNLILIGGTHTGSSAVLNGTAGWQFGTLQGSWQVGAGHTLDVSTNSAKTISGVGTVITNNGTVNMLAGSSSLNLANNPSIVNNGTWTLQADVGVTAGGSATPSFVNNGVLRKTGSSGTSSFATAVLGFTNAGTVDVQTGKLALPPSFNNAGRLMGDGTLQTLNSTTNNGTIAPGSFGTGTLTLSMSTFGSTLFQSAGAVLEVDLTSLAAFDLLAIEGSALLGGELALNCLGDCSFDVGDSFTILDATGSLNGSFSSVTLSGFGTGAFDVIYDAPTASVRLLVTQAVTPVPEASSLAMAAAGLGVIAALSRRRRTLR